MRHLMTWLSLACLLPTAGCVGWFGSHDGRVALKGEITSAQRMTLPASARVRVTLIDVTRDATVTRLEIPDPGQEPIAFRLSVPRALVEPSHEHALRATIMDGEGNTLWRNSEPEPVQPVADAGAVTLRVQQTSDAGNAREWTRYACPGLVVSADADRAQAVVRFPDGKRVLPSVRSASGAKYADSGTVFWRKGRTDALVTYQGRTYRNCVATAPLTGIGAHIRAHGNEPFWTARVLGADGSDGIQFALGISQTEVVRTPTARVEREAEGAATVYRGESRDRSISVRVLRSQCTDSMNGDTFPLTVRVTTPQGTVRGCGRWLERENDEGN